MTTQRAPQAGNWKMVVTGVFVTLLVIVFARLAYGLILPPMRTGLGLSYQAAGTLGTVTAFGYFSFVLFAGMAAARWGARNSVIFGITVVSLGFAGLSLSTAYVWLAVFMAMLGIGTAFTYAPLVSLLAMWFPDKRGLVIGFLTSGVGLGMLIIGLLVPALNDLFGDSGWRITWGVFACVGVAVLAAVLLFIRNPPATAPARAGQPVPATRKVAIYTNPRVVTVGLVYGIVGLTYIVQAIFMVSFMIEAGIADTTAGRLVAMMGILSLMSGPVWGSLSDRIGRGTALVLVMSLVFIGMTLPVLNQSLGVFTVHYVMMGCTVSGLFTLVQAAGTEQVASRDVPIAFSFVTLFFAGGQFVGPAITGALIEWTGDFRPAVGIASATLALGVFLTWRVRALPKPRSEEPVAAAGTPGKEHG